MRYTVGVIRGDTDFLFRRRFRVRYGNRYLDTSVKDLCLFCLEVFSKAFPTYLSASCTIDLHLTLPQSSKQASNPLCYHRVHTLPNTCINTGQTANLETSFNLVHPTPMSPFSLPPTQPQLLPPPPSLSPRSSYSSTRSSSSSPASIQSINSVLLLRRQTRRRTSLAAAADGEGEERGDLATVLEPRPCEAVGCLGIGEVLDGGFRGYRYRSGLR